MTNKKPSFDFVAHKLLAFHICRRNDFFFYFVTGRMFIFSHTRLYSEGLYFFKARQTDVNFQDTEQTAISLLNEVKEQHAAMMM